MRRAGDVPLRRSPCQCCRRSIGNVGSIGESACGSLHRASTARQAATTSVLCWHHVLAFPTAPNACLHCSTAPMLATVTGILLLSPLATATSSAKLWVDGWECNIVVRSALLSSSSGSFHIIMCTTMLTGATLARWCRHKTHYVSDSV